MNAARPDSLLLRLPIFVCVLGLLAGHGLTYFVKGGEVKGRWIILISLCAGLCFSLAYTAHLLFVRLRMCLSHLLAMLLVHALMLTTVSQSIFWLSGETGKAGVRCLSVNMLILSAASLALLFRASVLALIAVNCLPEEWSRSAAVRGERGILLRHEYREPRLYLYAFYWFSPLVWWLLLVVSLLSTRAPSGPAVFFSSVGVATFLQLRLYLSGSVYCSTFLEWCHSRKLSDKNPKREAFWYLVGSGLPAAGIVAFYGFCFAAMRTHQETLGVIAARQQIIYTAQLRDMRPARLPDSENAKFIYESAGASMRGKVAWDVFYDRWDHPDAAIMLRNGQHAQQQYHAAAKMARCQFSVDLDATDPTAVPSLMDYRLGINLLMLQGRMAARDGNWNVLLENARTGFLMAMHLHQQPFFITGVMGSSLEETAIMSLVPALAETVGADAPPDKVVASAQEMLREFERRRGKPLVNVMPATRLWMLRDFDRRIAAVSRTWPGCVDIKSLATDHPVLLWQAREALIQHYDYLVAIASNPLMAVRAPGDSRWKIHPSLQLLATGIVDDQDLIYRFEVACAYRLADAALGAVRYRNLNGGWPVSLHDCVPEYLAQLPEDPYVPGSAVRFAHDPPRVFSAGANTVYEPLKHHHSHPSDKLFSSVGGDLYQSDLALQLNSPDPLYVPESESRPKQGVEVQAELKYLNNADAEYRIMALRNLSATAPSHPETMPTIAAFLGSEIPEERLYAAYAVGRLGSAAYDALEELERLSRQDLESDVRHFARQAARKIHLFDSLMAPRAPATEVLSVLQE